MIRPVDLSPRAAAILGGLIFLVCIVAVGCGTPGVKAVDIYPEDMCAFCRMAVSDQRFACEIVTESSEALKFDDIGCLDHYLKAKPGTVTVAEIFYKDYASKNWVRASAATIVETDVMTPMGSGKVAFADPRAAAEFQRVHVADGEK